MAFVKDIMVCISNMSHIFHNIWSLYLQIGFISGLDLATSLTLNDLKISSAWAWKTWNLVDASILNILSWDYSAIINLKLYVFKLCLCFIALPENSVAISTVILMRVYYQ